MVQVLQNLHVYASLTAYQKILQLVPRNYIFRMYLQMEKQKVSAWCDWLLSVHYPPLALSMKLISYTWVPT